MRSPVSVPILLVSHREAERSAWREALSPLGERRAEAASAAEALSQATAEPWAVVIIDLDLPAPGAFAVGEAIRRATAPRLIPLIFASAAPVGADPLTAIFALPAADVVAPPADGPALRARVMVFAELLRQQELAAQASGGTFDLLTHLSERTRSERELEEHRIRLDLAVEAADLGLLYRDALEDRYAWSDRAKRLLGLAEDAQPTLAGFLARVHPDDRACLENEIAALMRVDDVARSFALEFRVLPAAGQVRHLAAHGIARTMLFDWGERRREVVATLQDVTQSREFEHSLQQRVAERTQALQDKTAQLESFCYTVAHDLRAPLRSINGFADFLIEELGALRLAEAVHSLERIKASTRRLDQLIQDLLSYSRVSVIDIELHPVPLGAVARAAVRELEEEITRRRATVAIAEPLPDVWAEQSILEQALLNLLSNAVKFTAPHSPAVVQIAAELRGGLVRLLVKDNGIGIAPEYHARIFRVFERLENARRYPGTGIGLAIVARAAERLGGACGLESRPGAGSTFWIELKAAPP